MPYSAIIPGRPPHTISILQYYIYSYMVSGPLTGIPPGGDTHIFPTKLSKIQNKNSEKRNTNTCNLSRVRRAINLQSCPVLLSFCFGYDNYILKEHCHGKNNRSSGEMAIFAHFSRFFTICLYPLFISFVITKQFKGY